MSLCQHIHSIASLTKQRVLLGILCYVAMTSCRDVTYGPIKKYYFPVEKLAEGPRVYIYKSELPDHPDDIWLFNTIQDGNRLYLEAKNYDSRHRLVQHQIEQIVSTGSVLSALSLYSYDSTDVAQITDVEIEAPNIFSWNEHKDEVLVYKVSYDDYAEEGAHTRLIRNRYSPRATKLQYGSKLLDGLSISTKELIESYKEGYIEIEMTSEEQYVEGIGRISYQKVLDGKLILSYKLKAFMPLAEYEALYGPLKDPILARVSS